MTTDLATLSTKRVSYQTATFLRFISEPSEVRCFFVKTKQSGFSPGMHGYYGSSRFKQLVEHIQPYDGNAIGIYYGLNPAFENCLSRSEHTLRPASATFSCKTADIVRRRLLLVDIDPEREPNSSATDDEKYGAYQLGRRIYRYLKNAGWPQPIVLDSGNGYHLLYRIDLPVDDGGLVRECLKTLATTFNCGNIKIDTSVHDATRIAKLPGTMVCKGESSEERPHRRSGFFKLPHRFDVVPRELLDKLAGSREPSRLKKTLKPLQPLTASPPEVISRARAYLAKLPPSISGQNGRNHFLKAACRLVDDFALPREQAEPLLEEYNIRCVPPFNERELADKLDSALAKVVARGGPSGSKSGSAIADPPRSGPRFVGSVPDFAFVAIDYVLGRCDKPIPLGEMIYRFSLWDRLHAGALIPDLVMRQLIWGARYDKNWRSRLVKKKKVIGAVSAVKTNNVCSDETCMLFGTGFSHRHYTVHMKNYPVLDSFRAKNDVNHIHGNRFLLYADEFKEGREQLQRQGQLFNVYWPAFILGGSPKVGWSWPQQLLVMGMVRELTRTKPKPGEGITGEVVKGGMVAATSNGSRLVPCHLLSRTQEYVAFAGNGKRKGRGYQIIGRTDKGWLHRSGYVLPAREPSRESNQKRRDLMRLFLTDLSFLSEELGLVPAGVLNGQWKSIGQMMDCLRTGHGNDWLEACTLRIYAPADWRSRWRGYFSNKLGFAWIPETPEDSAIDAASGVVNGHGSSYSAHEIRAFLKKQGWTQRRLAEAIANLTGRPCSSRRVERNLGNKGPTADFLKDFALVRAQTQ